MEHYNDVVKGFHAEEILQRVHIYRDKARYDTKFIHCYQSQLRQYHALKDKIKDENIKGHLSELEDILLGR